MPADNAKLHIGWLAGRYPGRIGHLYSPHAAKGPYSFIPYALDNGRFAVWANNREWNQDAFLKLLETHGRHCRWVVVPDAVGDRNGTLREWDAWAPRLAKYTLAMAVQDGMTPQDVPSEASVIFVGGTTEWKRKTIRMWCENFQRVHVGRINTYKWLWHCHEAGAESCDGTGWCRGDKKQLRGLERYLEESSGKGRAQRALFS